MGLCQRFPALGVLVTTVGVGAAALAAGAATSVKRQGELWLLENARLRVTVDAHVGGLTVLDKASGQQWRQPAAGVSRRPQVSFRRAAVSPKIDGDLAEWRGQPVARLTFRMTADAKKVDSDGDCSTEVWCAWDDAGLYLAARVRDDDLRFGQPGLERWWERDSMELWVGSRQVGLNLSPRGSQARSARARLDGGRIALRPDANGYSVEAALPWKLFPAVRKPAPGTRFAFAAGVNDADATGSREGQLYFPATWAHSRPSTFAEATLADEQGQAPARAPRGEAKFRNVREVAGPRRGIAFEADFGATRGKPNTLSVTLTVPDDASDLFVEADMARRDAEVGSFPSLEPFLLGSPGGVLVVADYCNGHAYPLDLKPFPRGGFSASRLDMPWIGVCDLAKGQGYAIIIETSDDASVHCRTHTVGDRKVVAPQVQWNPCKRKFAYPRRLVYHFAPGGGYVALAKRYRAYAREHGLLVTFAEKLKKNPNIRRLFGAPDVWGDASLSFARQAKAAGVDKMLIHGRSSPKDMKAINELGYLTSEYDNYTDILPLEPGKTISSNRDHLPASAVLNADGKRKTAWLTFDKKMQYMKRCPALWARTAKVVVPKLIETHPFIGRFIDVTTAEDLYECYDPKHPLSRGEKRECGPALLSYVRSQGLVMGGEHGIWWAVPHLDYIEGMMSGGFYSWPAGHLKHPKSKDEEFASPWGHKYGKWAGYAKYGIGHEYRVPLWELVFHDCIVSTWYWGDASDWLLEAAPEVTPKKDAFNVLYGTIPLMWANRAGSWQAGAGEIFLRTYRNTCKLHEVVAGTEMLSHEFVTPDRAVQRTRFSDGTEVVVNFGTKPYAAKLAGRSRLLPQNGFAVKGPRIEQSLALVNGRPVTSIRTADYLFTDASGVELTVRRIGDEQLRIHVGAGKKAADLWPRVLAPKWDMASTRLFVLDAKGQRTAGLGLRPRGDGFEFGPFTKPTVIEALWGAQAALPDLRFDAAGLAVSPDRPKQGQAIELTVTVRNDGGAAAQGAEIAFYADACDPARKLAGLTLSLKPGARDVVRVKTDTSRLDGLRRIIAAVNPERKLKELCELNNQTSRRIEVAPDYSRWPHRRKLVVKAGKIERDSEPVVMPLDLPKVDPASVRVVECGDAGDLKAQAPAQFDAAKTGRGELCFLLTGRTPAGATRRFALLWADAPAAGKPSGFLAPPQCLWDSASATIRAETYQARLDNGMIAGLAAVRNGAAGKPFVSKLMLSSKETGWSDEPGTVERLEVLHAGPVRVAIVVRKALQAGVVYEKTYTFYPRRFDLAVSVNKPAGGLYSRAYYLRTGQYADDKGLRATVDGRGDDEGIYGKNQKPKWHAVYAGDWAHSCIALSRLDGIAYWDSGSWGGIGLTTGATKGVRMSYVIHPGAKDAGFAAHDHRRLTSPPAVSME